MGGKCIVEIPVGIDSEKDRSNKERARSRSRSGSESAGAYFDERKGFDPCADSRVARFVFLISKLSFDWLCVEHVSVSVPP